MDNLGKYPDPDVTYDDMLVLVNKVIHAAISLFILTGTPLPSNVATFICHPTEGY